LDGIKVASLIVIITLYTLDMNKSTGILIRLSEEEKKILREKCALSSDSMSSFVRKLIIGEEIIVKTDLQAVFQLRKIGVNINQIAHRINSSPINIPGGIAELNGLREKLYETLNRIII
jgi:hypothetical protein